MPKTMRQVAAEIDPLGDRRSGIRLSSLLEQHRWAATVPRSGRTLRELVRRHSASAMVRFLSYNTYLTEAHITLPDPFPDVRITAKPALHARAREIGQQVMADYDFASLYEVMQERQRDEILAAWGSSPPDNFFGGTLSSLFTISQEFKIGRREQHTYGNKGKVESIDIVPIVGVGPSVDISLDSDFYANKGVMLTEIVTPFGTIEIFSTHLMFGGGFGQTGEDLINAATPFEKHISESNPAERFATQLAQIDELIEFYHAQHHLENVAIICGDFNIDGSDAGHFAQLKNRLAVLRMRDAWADGPFINNVSGGQTARNDDDDTKAQESNFDNICAGLSINGDYCDDSRNPQRPPPVDCVGRFDYIFVEDSHQPPHTCNLDLSRVRRRQFRRRQPSDGQFFLSDHLGLETTLIVSKI